MTDSPQDKPPRKRSKERDRQIASILDAPDYPDFTAALQGLARLDAYFNPLNERSLPAYFRAAEEQLLSDGTPDHNVMAEAFDEEARAQLAAVSNRLSDARAVLEAAQALLPPGSGTSEDSSPGTPATTATVTGASPELPSAGIGPEDFERQQRIRSTANALQELAMVECLNAADKLTAAVYRLGEKATESANMRTDWQRHEEKQEVQAYAQTRGLEKFREEWDEAARSNALLQAHSRLLDAQDEVPLIVNGLVLFAGRQQDRLNAILKGPSPAD